MSWHHCKALSWYFASVLANDRSTPQPRETCTSSGINPIGPWHLREEVCDGGELAHVLQWQQGKTFSTSSLPLPVSASTHWLPCGHSRTPCKVTHTRHPGEDWDRQSYTVGCMHALPPFHWHLKTVKLKGGEEESIDRGVAISCEYLRSLAFSYFQQISVGLTHTYFCSVRGESRTTASSVTHTNTVKQTQIKPSACSFPGLIHTLHNYLICLLQSIPSCRMRTRRSWLLHRTAGRIWARFQTSQWIERKRETCLHFWDSS